MTATFSFGPIVYLLLDPTGPARGWLESRGTPPHSRIGSTRRLSDHDHTTPARQPASIRGRPGDARLLPAVKGCRCVRQRPRRPFRPRAGTISAHRTMHPVVPRGMPLTQGRNSARLARDSDGRRPAGAAPDEEKHHEAGFTPPG